MSTSTLISAIDEEIERLTQVRALLTGRTARASSAAHRRPRQLSPEARKRIADAQKRRWAAQKKAAKQAS